MGNKSILGSTKLQMFLLFLVGGFLFVIGWVFWGLPSAGLNSVAHQTANEITPVNYVMAKIQSMMSLFSLEGREINRKYLSLDDQGLNGPHVAKVSVPESRIQGAIEPKKRSANAKEKTTTNRNKPAVVQAKAPLKTAVDGKKYIDSERKKRLAEWETYNKKMKDYQEKKARSETHKNAPEQNLQQYQYSQNTPATAPVVSTDENKRPKKTIEEWKQEMATASSPEAARNIMVKFVAAYKNKDIEEIEFYMVVQGLLKSSDENQKGLGLYALRGTPSYTTYLLLVKQQAEFSPTLQKYIQETLMSYHNGGLGTLQQALTSKDNQLIAKTLEVLKTGLKNIKNGTNEGLVDARYRRDTDFVSFNAKNYLTFAKILEQLGQSGEGSIKTSALEIAQLINSAQGTTQPVVASTP